MNDILFGKKGLQNVVSIEPTDGSVEVFFEGPNGVHSELFEHKYWLLSPEQCHSGFKRLKGNLYYKWGALYTERSAWQRDRKIYKPNIYSVYNPKESCAIKDGYSCFLGMEIADVSVLSFDIETTTLSPDDENAKVLLISCAYKKNGVIEQKLFSYDEYDHQGEMIASFCEYVKYKNPSILLGHNVFGFDLPYLATIANKFSVTLALGRDNSDAQFEDFERKFRVDGTRDLPYHDCRIYGREVIDSMFLSIKADAYERKYNSYGLKKIIEHEGWEQPGRILYDAQQIRFKYKDPEEFKKIKDYCIGDALDAITLYEKFIPPFFYLNRHVAKGSFQSLNNSASGSQLNSIMCRAYLQDAHSLPKASEQVQFEGAISIGIPNIYKNVLKIDINSLYPSLMTQYKIFPKNKDPKEYFPLLVTYFREERLKNKKLSKETKKDYYKHLEQSQKIIANSLYGFLGSPGLLFNYPEGASEITRRGRDVLKFTIKWATGEDYELSKING
jgi:DNA polymerase, archaea type